MIMKNKINVHIFLSSLTGIENRFFKEASYLMSNKIFEQVIAIGKCEIHDKECENHKSGVIIKRCKTILARVKHYPVIKKLPTIRKLIAAISYLQYFVYALRICIRQAPSHISVHNLQCLPIGVVIKLVSGCKLVYVPHELESERMGLKGLAKSIQAVLENACIKHCDQIVVVCEPILEWYRNKYGLSNLHVVRNVPSRMDTPIRSIGENAFRKKFQIPEDSIVFIYQGLIDESRGVLSLIDSFKSSPHHLVFMGYGGLVEHIKSLKIKNIHYQNSVPAADITSYTSTADIGLFIVPGSLPLSYQLSLPNKFFEYMHSEIPVIVSKNLTYLSDLVDAHKVGFKVDESGLSKLLSEIDIESVMAMKPNIKKFTQNVIWDVDAVVYHEVYK